MPKNAQSYGAYRRVSAPRNTWRSMGPRLDLAVDAVAAGLCHRRSAVSPLATRDDLQGLLDVLMQRAPFWLRALNPMLEGEIASSEG
jgi:hypothetical protein